MPHIARHKRRTNRPSINPIPISLRPCRMPRMKIRRYFRDLRYSHRRRQNVIQCLHKIPHRHRRLRPKCRHLRQCMHPRIRPPRSLRQYFFAGDSSNCRGKCPLHRCRVRLHLPSRELRSVIGENHFEIAHAIFRVLRLPSLIQLDFKDLVRRKRAPSAP
jgi:hypothetical protein